MTGALLGGRRHFVRDIGCCLALAAAVAADAAKPATDSPEVAFERYRSKINLHDFDRLADDVIDPQARFVFAGESHRGIAAARAAFNRTWATIPDEVYAMDEVEWITRDSASAVVSFRYRYRGTMSNGQVLSGGGFGTNVFRRTGSGWRLIYEHLSPDPALQPARLSPSDTSSKE